MASKVIFANGSAYRELGLNAAGRGSIQPRRRLKQSAEIGQIAHCIGFSIDAKSGEASTGSVSRLVKRQIVLNLREETMKTRFLILCRTGNSFALPSFAQNKHARFTNAPTACRGHKNTAMQ
jgi:hypothetical protein